MWVEVATSGLFARSVLEKLRANGHSAYLVGGCVRDLLLGRNVADFDIATSATPDQVLALFPKADHVGAHFGVVIVRHREDSVEVATFRSDRSYCDGRHPDSVTFESDPRQDVLRRDFTINALLMDPDTGDVIDYVNGRADLDRRLIRTVGDPDRRFAEDQLRMLRAVRFAARLDFTIDAATMAAIRRLSARIHNVSAERIRDELSRILTEGGPHRGFELLEQSGLLAEILPEVAAMRGVDQPPEFHPEGDVWIHTRLMLEKLENPDLALAWGVLLHDVGKPPTFRIAERIRFDGHVEAGVRIAHDILTRLRYPNELIQQVEALVANHMRFSDVPRMRESTLKRFFRLHRFDHHLELHRVDCLSSHGHLDNYHFAREKLAELPPEQIRPPRLLTGDDLIQAGYRPGPQFKQMLEAAETAQLEGTIATKEEALSLLRVEFPPQPL